MGPLLVGACLLNDLQRLLDIDLPHSACTQLSLRDPRQASTLASMTKRTEDTESRRQLLIMMFMTPISIISKITTQPTARIDNRSEPVFQISTRYHPKGYEDPSSRRCVPVMSTNKLEPTKRRNSTTPNHSLISNRKQLSLRWSVTRRLSPLFPP